MKNISFLYFCVVISRVPLIPMELPEEQKAKQKRTGQITSLAVRTGRKLSEYIRQLDFDNLQQCAVSIKELEFPGEPKYFNELLNYMTRDIIIGSAPINSAINPLIRTVLATTIIDAYVRLIKCLSKDCSCFYGGGWNPGFRMCNYCKREEKYYHYNDMRGSFFKAKEDVEKGIVPSYLTNNLINECIEQLNSRTKSQEEEQLLTLLNKQQFEPVKQ